MWWIGWVSPRRICMCSKLKCDFNLFDPVIFTNKYNVHSCTSGKCDLHVSASLLVSLYFSIFLCFSCPPACTPDMRQAAALQGNKVMMCLWAMKDWDVFPTCCLRLERDPAPFFCLLSFQNSFHMKEREGDWKGGKQRETFRLCLLSVAQTVHHCAAVWGCMCVCVYWAESELVYAPERHSKVTLCFNPLCPVCPDTSCESEIKGEFNHDAFIFLWHTCRKAHKNKCVMLCWTLEDVVLQSSRDWNMCTHITLQYNSCLFSD